MGICEGHYSKKTHIKCCKQILGIRQNSCNAAVYGELGRYPLYINRYIRIVKYCLRIMQLVKIYANYNTMYEYDATSQNICKLQNDV